MASVTIVSAGTCTAPTGTAVAAHLIYAANSGRYWLFYLDSTNTNQIKTQSSVDGSTWSAGATLTLTNAPPTNDGRNFGLCYKNISSNDVVYLAIYENTGTDYRPHVARATISGSTITFGADNEVAAIASGQVAVTVPSVPIIVLDSNNRPVVSVTDTGNRDVWRATNTDSGASWTNGWGAETTNVLQPANDDNNGAFFDLGSGNLLILGESAAAAEPASFTNVLYSKWTSSWAAQASVFTADLGSGVDPNNFGACALSTSDIHCVQRSGSNTYVHRRYNGTSWSNGDAITNQTSKAGSGPVLVSDGTNVWLFIVDSDAANTIRYCKWTSGSGWGSWTALETTTQTRNYLSACPQVQNNTLAVCWSQTNGSNFDIVFESLNVGGGPTPTPISNLPILPMLATQKIRGGSWLS